MSVPYVVLNAPYHYIVLHESLDTPGLIAVHAAHAAGESSFDGPAPSDTRCVVLKARDGEALAEACRHLAEAGLRYVAIVETDGVRTGQITAIGVEPVRERRADVQEILAGFKVFR